MMSKGWINRKGIEDGDSHIGKKSCGIYIEKWRY